MSRLPVPGPTLFAAFGLLTALGVLYPLNLGIPLPPWELLAGAAAGIAVTDWLLVSRLPRLRVERLVAYLAPAEVEGAQVGAPLCERAHLS